MSSSCYCFIIYFYVIFHQGLELMVRELTNDAMSSSVWRSLALFYTPSAEIITALYQPHIYSYREVVLDY